VNPTTLIYDDTELASGIKIAMYHQLEAEQKRDEIADFIYKRFTERYTHPLVNIPKNKKHGFCIMAVSCLMIEALESFRQGWAESKGDKSRSAFCYFFDSNDLFKDFRGHAQPLYKHVRCGILHQGETTGGWRIRRSGPLFDPESKKINATVFLKRLSRYLKNYCDALKSADWDDEVWMNLRKKMKAICDNCKTP